MQDFEIEKKGYSKQEVKETIDNLVVDYEKKLAEQKDRIVMLKQQTEELTSEINQYQSKDKNISGALIAAVNTAKQIENSSKNVYELEIKRIRLLYNKWEDFLKEMMEKYPEMKENFDPEVIMNGFKKAIDDTIEANFSSMKQTKKVNNASARHGLQSLLSRMNARHTTECSRPHSSYVKNLDKTKTPAMRTVILKRNEKPSFDVLHKVKADNVYKLETQRINVGLNSEQIKPITNITLNNEDKYDNLVDKYLNTNNLESENFAKNAYSKQLLKKEEKKKKDLYSLYPEPNASGFDLKEALNPTENLDDIMKAFDFFNDDDED